MTIDTQTTLELLLIDTVEKELTVMQSFCRDQFPYDIPTTVAMRMSRSVVSAICSVATSGAQPGAVSHATATSLQAANARLADLSKEFEYQLAKLPADAAERKIWIA